VYSESCASLEGAQLGEGVAMQFAEKRPIENMMNILCG